jgi:hypothetical protein
MMRMRRFQMYSTFVSGSSTHKVGGRSLIPLQYRLSTVCMNTTICLLGHRSSSTHRCCLARQDVKSRSWLVRMYYRNRMFMGVCCISCEVLYLSVRSLPLACPHVHYHRCCALHMLAETQTLLPVHVCSWADVLVPQGTQLCANAVTAHALPSGLPGLLSLAPEP